jgi:hypothetical protein
LIPHEVQKIAFNYFIDNQERILNALCDAVFEYCQEHLKKYKELDCNSIFGIAQFETVDDVKTIISIDAITILEEEKDNFSYVGFGCGCSWDEEHGLRVTMHKDKVISVDDDSSYYAYEEILKDKMTEEEWKTYNENQLKTKEENLARCHKERGGTLANEKVKVQENPAKFNKNSEEILALEKDENKKWWKFWN